eukprot:gb/GFBE01027160.1/.p1 GENE.gb/GFBE01027160.1/~~gb/GFBE01027160.1/.p1  ORF type:complete len:278 (+),score=66.79 gb/GFBE01027160.1/:1-834(+)
MPIDYSKFDGIGEDDEDDLGCSQINSASQSGGDLHELLEQCIDRLSWEDQEERQQKVGGQGRPKEGTRSGAGLCDDDDDFGLGYNFGDAYGDDFDDLGDFGLDGFGGSSASQSLDIASLRDEAWQLLLRRLIVPAGGTSLGSASGPRNLLLEAELQLLARRYRPALLAALALQLLTDSSLLGLDGAAKVADTKAVLDMESDTVDPACWAVPAAVIEMVCSYQLGDRNRAVLLRDCLQMVDRSLLSRHLERRFQGTAEVLELVPQFLNLLKAESAHEQ